MYLDGVELGVDVVEPLSGAYRHNRIAGKLLELTRDTALFVAKLSATAKQLAWSRILIH
jgi:hypothetical protein